MNAAVLPAHAWFVGHLSPREGDFLFQRHSSILHLGPVEGFSDRHWKLHPLPHGTMVEVRLTGWVAEAGMTVPRLLPWRERRWLAVGTAPSWTQADLREMCELPSCSPNALGV